MKNFSDDITNYQILWFLVIDQCTFILPLGLFCKHVMSLVIHTRIVYFNRKIMIIY